MLVLRFKQPGNSRVRGAAELSGSASFDVPLGIGLIFLVLAGAAMPTCDQGGGDRLPASLFTLSFSRSSP